MGTVDDFYTETRVPFGAAVERFRSASLRVTRPDRIVFSSGADLLVEDSEGCGVWIFRLSQAMIDATCAYHEDLHEDAELQEGGVAFFKFYSPKSHKGARPFAVRLGDILESEIVTEWGDRILVPALWSVEQYFGELPVPDWTDRELASAIDGGELEELAGRGTVKSPHWASVLEQIRAEIARRRKT